MKTKTSTLALTVTLLATALAGTASAGSYEVRKGDTLYGISKATGISQQAIKAANGIKGNVIYHGTSLTIPETHLVRPKETLSKISRIYGISVTKLHQWNRLASPDRIVEGQVLRLTPDTADSQRIAGEGRTGIIGAVTNDGKTRELGELIAAQSQE